MMDEPGRHHPNDKKNEDDEEKNICQSAYRHNAIE